MKLSCLPLQETMLLVLVNHEESHEWRYEAGSRELVEIDNLDWIQPSVNNTLWHVDSENEILHSGVKL